MVVGTGLFLMVADTVLVGSGNDFRLVDERHRGSQAHERARETNREPVQEGA